MAAVSTSARLPDCSTSFHSGCIYSGSNALLEEPDISSLPVHIKEKLNEINEQFKHEELTQKGYEKQRLVLLYPYMVQATTFDKCEDSCDYGYVEPDQRDLPNAILEQLTELQNELKNEEITQKGYEKKRFKVLEPFMFKVPALDTLPDHIQKSIDTLQKELEDEEITEKGFKKKKIRLLKPFLIPVNLTSNDNVGKSYLTPKKEKSRSEEKRGVRRSAKIFFDGDYLFRCEICGETFKQGQSYSGHCRAHRRTDKKTYQCTECSLSYSCKSHLKDHMYKHTGEYPYMCSVCGKGFAGRTHLKYHEMRHRGEKQIVCSVCRSRFWSKTNFETHKIKGCTSKNEQEILRITATDSNNDFNENISITMANIEPLMN